MVVGWWDFYQQSTKNKQPKLDILNLHIDLIKPKVFGFWVFY